VKIILDLDTGIDDALAIAYCLGSPDAELIGITGTYGNVTVEQGVKNSRALLSVLGYPDIPVIPGRDRPWGRGPASPFSPSEASSFIHGSNGLGGVEVNEYVAAEDELLGGEATEESSCVTSSEDGKDISGESAMAFYRDAVQRYGDDLTIVPTGALTTVAEAMKRYEDVTNARIVLMGGALTVPGNVSAVAEANISQDPDAADYVFRHGTNVTMVGLDVTLQTLLTKAHTHQWREQGTRAGKLYAEIVDYYIGAYATTSPYLGGCGLHDPLAVAVALDPSLVTFYDTNLKVDCGGRTIGDEQRMQDPVKRTHVALAVDATQFVEELMVRVGNLFGRAG